MGKSSDIFLPNSKIMMAWLLFCFLFSLGCVHSVSCEKENFTAPAEEAILLSGGAYTFTSVEVFSPSTGLSCSLPSLPDLRDGHTMDSTLICGGGNPSSTCLTFSSGKWITSHRISNRYAHTSWETGQGVVLMGGDDHPTTSEIVQMGEEQGQQGEPSFPMKYSTRFACSMADLTNPTVIITGGLNTMQTVSRYGAQGFVEALPALVVGRQVHGCGSYLRDADGTQVFLVAGGLDSSGNRISSTEVLTTSSSAWSLTTPLPRTLIYLSCVTAGGKLYATGGYDDDEVFGDPRDEVLAWLDEEQQWVEQGKMMIGRYYHAAAAIKLDDDAMAHCKGLE